MTNVVIWRKILIYKISEFIDNIIQIREDRILSNPDTLYYKYLMLFDIFDKYYNRLDAFCTSCSLDTIPLRNHEVGRH